MSDDSPDVEPTLLECDMVILQQMLFDGNTSAAIEFSEGLLERSRSKEERNPELEVRIRMERALLGAVVLSMVGAELRWCTDRLKALRQGSFLHGIALLNLAAWHRNRGETMMALATHAEISPSSGHPIEIRGLSRLEAGRIMIGLNDLDPAMRHLWTARECLSQSGLTTEALASSLEWLDLALEEIVEESPRMSERLAQAAPREGAGSTWVPANPEDVREVVEALIPVLLADVSGNERSDIGLILDASDVLGEASWHQLVSERISEIQDPNVCEALQS